jgi:phage terminase Nu1 subunit (DNA packaging protein)
VSADEQNAEPMLSLHAASQLVMLSPRRIQQLVREGVVPKPSRGQYPLVALVQGVLLEERKRNQQGSKRLDEDARLRAAQADLRTLELRKMRREVVDQKSVGIVVGEVLTVLFAAIDALPARMTIDLTGRSQFEVRKLLQDEVTRVRENIHAGLGELVARAETVAPPSDAA